MRQDELQFDGTTAFQSTENQDQAAGALLKAGKTKKAAHAMEKATLWRPEFEHDACGIGLMAHVNGVRSHEIVRDALEILVRLAHRGGTGADPDTGDGAGVLVQVPDRFLRKKTEFDLPAEGKYAVGMFFLPMEQTERQTAEEAVEAIVKEEKFTLIGWRTVPTNLHACGAGAWVSAPSVRQMFITWKKSDLPDDVRLFVLRKRIEKAMKEQERNVYIPSLSSRTMVYKGMMQAWQVSDFYPDLLDEDFVSAIALVHSRYSTNTFPNWDRAQPFRFAAHNGEINTLKGCEHAVLAASSAMDGGRLAKRFADILPILDEDGSDSTKFDNLLEFLVTAGRSLPQALFMMLPGPWSKDTTMDDNQREYFRYAACLTTPWDGPAAMCFTDGRQVGAVLDRNGLRPARWVLTSSNILVLASESGVVDIPPAEIVRRGKLGPNQMLLLDMEEGTLLEDRQIKDQYLNGPWKQWLPQQIVKVEEPPYIRRSKPNSVHPTKRQRLFGWTYEDRMVTVLPIAQTGVDPVGAMGYDAPIAALSDKPQPLFHYFKQLFAQVTNPPIDALQEECVTGMDVFLGPNGDPTLDKADNCRKIHLASPILHTAGLEKLLSGIPGFSAAELHMVFDPQKGLEAGLDDLFAAAEKAIAEGNSILVLTDRLADAEHAPIPSLLATSGVHHHLIRKGLRGLCSIVVDSYEPREVHHVACLIGYGAKAVYLRGVYEAVEALADEGYLETVSLDTAMRNVLHGYDHGVLKIMSKMGISCVDGYHSAQIFEALGLSQELVDRFFTGTVTRVGGMSLSDLENETLRRHADAVEALDGELPSGGRFQYKRDGEEHLYNPQSIHMLQTAVRTGDYELFKEFVRLIEGDKPVTLRNLLGYRNCKPIPIDEVEPVEKLVRRFKTGAMSYGSISQEAHECLALAMNQLGGKSNSGEGGEAVERLFTERNSAIKQIASGRFGVTGPYLASAKEIQIKMAQGAKPGEGGHLPGRKVYPWIARTRHSTAGVGLISPPPHHDIYSIEDLAQLIYDLKNANPDARINVKLVSEAGVGTIAAGVAKGGADVILISGYDGGSGASPRTSLQHAGLPWELGLAETHQTLVANGLRGRVRVETDGKLMTGRDIAIAALLGAEEFGFATLPLVAMGCVMMRVCNLDTCPVGVATQNPALRCRFTGKPEHVINLMRFLAQNLRENMAELGFHTLDQMVGMAGHLAQVKQSPKTDGMDLSGLIPGDQPLPWRDLKPHMEEHNRLFHDMVRSLVEQGDAVVQRPICNTERAVATQVSAFISREYGRLPDGRVRFRFHGTAGQSFGAFATAGIELTIEGDANDYLGKGLCGARIIIKAPQDAGWSDKDNLLAGNVALFGATGGELYLAGRAGERFCVRNSGAIAVCEGVGDHGCEYMTGGTAVILGSVGRNFASGMSGGIAYVLDDGNFRRMVNKNMVALYELDALDLVLLYRYLTNHVNYTGSKIAAKILEKWPSTHAQFVKVLPHDYKEMLEAMDTAERDGLEGEEKLERAFQIKTGMVQ
jgi:glutamate synthase (ferredoxin)